MVNQHGNWKTQHGNWLFHLQIRGLLSKRTMPEGCWTFHTDNETDAVFKGFFPLKTCYLGVSILNLRGIPT